MRLASLIGHCSEAVAAIAADERPADNVINYFFRSRKYLGARDRAFIAETVYHVLRHRRRLEWLAGQYFAAQGLPAPHAEALFPSLVALALMEEADEESHAQELAAAVTERAEIPGAQRFVPSARDFLQRTDTLNWPPDPVARLAIEFSLPDWLAPRIVDMLGLDEARRLASVFNQPAPVILRVNPMKAPREAVQSALAAEGFECDPTPLSPFGLRLRERSNAFTSETFKRGWFEIQDEASQIVSLCVDPRPGARVLDACAGGGGKTLHLSALMKGRGEIIALDIYKRRLDSLRDRARRDDCQNIRVRLIGAEDSPAAELVGKMQYVLIDAPCTGLGVLRRNPDARWKVTPDSARELALKQRALLDRYAACVAPGGRLVYATCSILREENEDVIEGFRAGHPEFAPADLAGILSRYGLAHLPAPGAHTLRLWPHIHGADGFFIAALHRKG